MRRVRLLEADPLDRWLATADFMDPDVSLRCALPEGEVKCAIYVNILEVLFFFFLNANIGLIMF
jgi:hypothetical protein